MRTDGRKDVRMYGRTDVRTDGHVTITSQPKFLGLIAEPAGKARQRSSIAKEIWGAFFWDYSGIGILGIDGICVLLGAIPVSE